MQSRRNIDTDTVGLAGMLSCGQSANGTQSIPYAVRCNRFINHQVRSGSECNAQARLRTGPRLFLQDGNDFARSKTNAAPPGKEAKAGESAGTRRCYRLVELVCWAFLSFTCFIIPGWRAQVRPFSFDAPYNSGWT